MAALGSIAFLGATLLASFSLNQASSTPPGDPPTASGCLACHEGIEDMHPEARLGCVDCHGGDASADQKGEAHVRAPATRVEDERVLPRDKDLAWIRFRNPMDLRVAPETCGACHGDLVEHLLASLHGTTAGHLSDGYYEVGLETTKGSKYSVFPVSDAPVSGGEVERLTQPPPFQERLPRDRLATHYTDLARKECMQCHLWSQGRAVRGRVGFDGDYRGAGCAACHVSYAFDGLSESADRSANRTEPGHPLRHSMTAAPPTQTCVSCHYGDASIGLHFRGLSQLPPTAPGGPEIPGTTSQLENRVFYLNDPAIVPPDVHHERGMHCIDCHTLGDVMGDGKLHGQMEYAVEISCTACHGTFTEPSELRTERGTPLEHLRIENGEVVLVSKVDGRTHVVPQVADVLDPASATYNPRAALAMTSAHSDVECYTCHASWNANFLGFHFSRLEQLTQLDLLTGKRTPGRVTTLEKVFATWKSFYAGRNERGAIAPYLTGFSTMGSVWDESGALLLDQVMPVTASGASGMTMIHHQPHSNRPTARSCVECHRTSVTWGMGSANFRLARQLAFVADRRGIETIAIDRGELTRSAALSKIVIPDVVDLVVQVDALQGHAQYVFAAEGGRGFHAVDLRDPTAARRIAFRASVNPRGLELAGSLLYVADGIGGLRIYDVENPAAPELLGRLPTFDAHDVEVRWPWAYVADGPAGLAIVNVSNARAPRHLAQLDLNGESTIENEAIVVETLFQYSRPVADKGAPSDARTRARNLCAVLDRNEGLRLVDVTEPELPELLLPTAAELSRTRAGRQEATYRGLALLSQIDLADAQGGERTSERDYAYVLSERGEGAQRRSALVAFDVTDPTRVARRERNRVAAGFATEQLVPADFYSPPTRRRILFTPGERGVYMADYTTTREPNQVGALPGLAASTYAIAFEEFPLDRMIDERGVPQKDISHPTSRWLTRDEVERILTVSKEELGTDELYERAESGPFETARLHLESLDRDRSGMLDETESVGGGGGAVDRDGDGRISLIELATATVPSTEPESTAMEPLAAVSAEDDSLLARLLDGTDPFAFDQDENQRLTRSEVERAFFTALDLDGNGDLSQDELSRHPGELRDLRFGDAGAARTFARADRNSDGRVTAREFQLGDAEWIALDADHDGAVRLLPPPHAAQRERGHVLAGSEWPSRRADLVLVPPGVDAERITRAFDRDGDGELDARETKARPDLFQAIDTNGDQRAERAELDRLIARLLRLGVDALPDDFVGRWDLDGDGEVGADEFPEAARRRVTTR